ncbi:AraC-like DNA-binding protein [Chitinophagaceae bacterium OAS944]|uniref:helix-turn-helix transcriptional regulator n=2 Tax=Niastella sp. OAS944 TaxID=2664089 RepID=UPI0035C80135|nr:AraC-like DNA-binding protein [Chitinophagaceae bacterium OAS944]
MDKINLANWDQVFSKAEQHMVFASDRYTDLQFHFEEPELATGSIHSVTTPGMQLTEFYMNAGQPFQLIDDNPKEAAESVFVLNGSAQSQFHNHSSSLSFTKGQHNLQYNREFTGNHIISTSCFHALTISYDPNFLKGLLQSDDPGTERLADCLHGAKTYLASHDALQCTARIAGVIGAIRECRFTGMIRYLFLESKMMELFVLQMEQAQLAADCKTDSHWSIADREKLYAVKDYIENAYLEVFSLKDLTYKFNLNEFKLKKGYKQLFETTVFGHVHQLRMKKAQALLQNKAMNVTEAAFFIGYNNVSSFCTEFKKRFGYSPGRPANLLKSA